MHFGSGGLELNSVARVVALEGFPRNPTSVARGIIPAMRRKGEMDTIVGRKPPHSTGNGKPPGRSSATHKALITRNLKLAFGQVTSEALPERWLELLDQLDKSEDKK